MTTDSEGSDAIKTQTRPQSITLCTAIPLYPPFRFGIVQEGLYRGSYPKPRNLPFLRTLSLKTIISLTPEPLDLDPTLAWADKQGLNVVQDLGLSQPTLIHIKVDKPKESITLSFPKLNQILQLIIDPSRGPMYVHCLDGSSVTGLVVMALRKLQAYTTASYLAECVRYTRDGLVAAAEAEFMEKFKGVELDASVPRPAWLFAGAGIGAGMVRKHPSLKIKWLNAETLLSATSGGAVAAIPLLSGGGESSIMTGSAGQAQSVVGSTPLSVASPPTAPDPSTRRDSVTGDVFMNPTLSISPLPPSIKHGNGVGDSVDAKMSVSKVSSQQHILPPLVSSESAAMLQYRQWVKEDLLLSALSSSFRWERQRSIESSSVTSSMGGESAGGSVVPAPHPFLDMYATEGGRHETLQHSHAGHWDMDPMGVGGEGACPPLRHRNGDALGGGYPSDGHPNTSIINPLPTSSTTAANGTDEAIGSSAGIGGGEEGGGGQMSRTLQALDLQATDFQYW